MKPEIVSIHDLKEFYISEGCHITELSNSAADPVVSIARARVEPGVTTRWHRLSGTVERYVIVEGQGSVELAGCDPEIVSTGDTVRIPANCPQRITNIGKHDLIFLAICSPRFLPESYQETGAPTMPEE